METIRLSSSDVSEKIVREKIRCVKQYLLIVKIHYFILATLMYLALVATRARQKRLRNIFVLQKTFKISYERMSIPFCKLFITDLFQVLSRPSPVHAVVQRSQALAMLVKTDSQKNLSKFEVKNDFEKELASFYKTSKKLPAVTKVKATVSIEILLCLLGLYCVHAVKL